MDEECRTVVEAPAPAFRFPRLTHAQWENTVADLFELDAPAGLSSEFNADPSVGSFDSDERRLAVTPGLWRDYQRAAEAIAERMTSTDVGWIAPGWSGLERRDAFLREFGLRAFRRPLDDDDRARRQWVQVLQGEPSDGPAGELVVRWPRSPLRLVVEVDPGAPEGAVCLEVAADRAPLPDGPHPVLGVTIRPVKDEPRDGGPA